MTPTFSLALDLISQPSITPEDGDCQRIIATRLTRLGFVCETIKSGGVTNLWAKRNGTSQGNGDSGPTLLFAGHTDVVPTGPLDQWTSPPFMPEVRDGKLYGRGAADMKTSIAAMVVACEEFVLQHPEHTGNIAFLITSDEEGPSIHGTLYVCEQLKKRNERLDYCIVGEPTCVGRLGDTIKNGRRGSMSGKLTVRGIQGHIAYPQLARNPIHQAMPALTELTGVEWDQGNAYYLPTSLQISNIHGGTGATNVIPGQVVIDFNFRFCTASTVESLQTRVRSVLDSHKLDYQLDWDISGHPFLTPRGLLSTALSAAVLAETGIDPELSTTGGTSDGRFISRICEQVIEFGPINESIHKIDEHILVADIEPLKNIYRRTLENLLP